MFSDEQIQSISQMLSAHDADSVRLAIAILETEEITTEHHEHAKTIMYALRDAINNDNEPLNTPAVVVRQQAMELMFGLSKKCLIDPIEVLFTCVNPGPAFDKLDDTLDI